MSLQRAAVNCEMCHGIAKDVDICEESDKRVYYGSKKDITLLSNSRNEAMKALEDQIINCKAYRDSSVSHAIRVPEMLDVCMNCDYSSPKIKDLVTKLLKDKKK